MKFLKILPTIAIVRLFLHDEDGLTPVFYAYVIAEYDKDQGYEDCDVRPDGSNHCTHGAQTKNTFI